MTQDEIIRMAREAGIGEFESDEDWFDVSLYDLKSFASLVAAPLQAQIDRLMLEYCPDEITAEQMQEWGNNQRPVEQAEQEPFDMDDHPPHERPQKPKECADGCPPLQVCDYCQTAEQAEQAPVAWRVRGYSKFKTGNPTPWRYVDGAYKPSVNNPDCCDFTPLYTRPVRTKDLTKEDKLALWKKWNMTAAQIDAVIAKYKEKNK